MIHPGETLENPVTGEVLVFHRTSAQTHGEEVFAATDRPHSRPVRTYVRRRPHETPPAVERRARSR